jgi:hypothetical protein
VDGRKLQNMLCVVPQSDSFDTATRAQLKNFNGAVLLSTADAVDQIATDAALDKLRDAQRLFPDCSKAGFRNAFEVGMFARFELTATPIRAMLNKALGDKKLNPDGVAALSVPKAPVVMDAATRNAIGSLAKGFGLSGTDLTPELYAKLNPER